VEGSKWATYNAGTVATLSTMATSILARRATASIAGLEWEGQVGRGGYCVCEEGSGKESKGGKKLHFDCG
jgi:hypothetical protein